MFINIPNVTTSNAPAENTQEIAAGDYPSTGNSSRNLRTATPRRSTERPITINARITTSINSSHNRSSHVSTPRRSARLDGKEPTAKTQPSAADMESERPLSRNATPLAITPVESHLPNQEVVEPSDTPQPLKLTPSQEEETSPKPTERGESRTTHQPTDPQIIDTLNKILTIVEGMQNQMISNNRQSAIFRQNTLAEIRQIMENPPLRNRIENIEANIRVTERIVENLVKEKQNQPNPATLDRWIRPRRTASPEGLNRAPTRITTNNPFSPLYQDPLPPRTEEPPPYVPPQQLNTRPAATQRRPRSNNADTTAKQTDHTVICLHGLKRRPIRHVKNILQRSGVDLKQIRDISFTGSRAMFIVTNIWYTEKMAQICQEINNSTSTHQLKGLRKIDIDPSNREAVELMFGQGAVNRNEGTQRLMAHYKKRADALAAQKRYWQTRAANFLDRVIQTGDLSYRPGHSHQVELRDFVNKAIEDSKGTRTHSPRNETANAAPPNQLTNGGCLHIQTEEVIIPAVETRATSQERPEPTAVCC